MPNILCMHDVCLRVPVSMHSVLCHVPQVDSHVHTTVKIMNDIHLLCCYFIATPTSSIPSPPSPDICQPCLKSCSYEVVEMESESEPFDISPLVFPGVPPELCVWYSAPSCSGVVSMVCVDHLLSHSPSPNATLFPSL